MTDTRITVCVPVDLAVVLLLHVLIVFLVARVLDVQLFALLVQHTLLSLVHGRLADREAVLSGENFLPRSLSDT